MKATKHTLIMSVLSMVICIAMLVGTTFAWFTDTASTGVNKIQAGNLDIKVEYKNATQTTYTEVSENTPIFDQTALWEPGHVEYAVIKLTNAGTLALKYQLALNFANEVAGKTADNAEIKLSELLRYALVEGDRSALTREALLAECGAGEAIKDTTRPSELFEVGAVREMTLVIWLPESVGNAANHNGVDVPSIEFGVTVAATQASFEADSFDNKYDANATLPTFEEETQVYEYGLTFTSGKHTLNSGVKATADNAPAVTVRDKDTVVTITGGEFTVEGSNAPVIRAHNDATVVISGGFFYANNNKLLEEGSGYILLKGGTFVNFDPSDFTVRYDYKVVEEQKENGDTWYTVVKIPEEEISTEFEKTPEEMRLLPDWDSIGELLRTDGYTYYFEFYKNQWNSSSNVYFYLRKATAENADIKITKKDGTIDYIRIDMKGLKVEDGSFIDDVFVYDEEITAIEFPNNGKWTADYYQQESGGHWYLRQLAPKDQQD